MPQNDNLISEYLDIDNAVSVTGRHFHSRYVKRLTEKFWPISVELPPYFILKKNSDYHIPENLAAMPVLVSELYRLWAATAQPRTEIVVDNPGAPREFYVLSEEVENFQPYTDYVTELPNPAVRAVIHNEVTRGFASLLVISLFLGQADLKDIGINDKHEFVHFDDDHALCLFWKDNFGTGFNFDITARDLQSLPQISDYVPFQWLGYKFMREFGMIQTLPDCTLQMLTNDPEFIAEKFLTLLVIILTPETLIKQFVDKYIGHEFYRDYIFSLIKQRKLMLEQQAFLIPTFRIFCARQRVTCIKQFVENTQAFSFLNRESSRNVMHEKLRLLRPGKLQHYILSHAEYSPEYKKEFLINQMQTRINSATELPAIMQLINELETAPQYAVIKARSRNWKLSFYGHRYKGEDVSKTFALLIKTAKNRMIHMALLDAAEGRLSTLQSLKKDYQDFLHTSRDRFFIRRTTSEKILQQAGKAANSAEYTELLRRYQL
jgi:hypothetical protein